MGNEKLVKQFTCPVCHADKTISELCAEPLIEAGKLSPELKISSLKTMVPMIEPAKITGVLAPAMFIEEDFCAECGTKFCRRVSMVDVPIQSIMGGGTPPQPRNVFR